MCTCGGFRRARSCKVRELTSTKAWEIKVMQKQHGKKMKKRNPINMRQALRAEGPSTGAGCRVVVRGSLWWPCGVRVAALLWRPCCGGQSPLHGVRTSHVASVVDHMLVKMTRMTATNSRKTSAGRRLHGAGRSGRLRLMSHERGRPGDVMGMVL